MMSGTPRCRFLHMLVVLTIVCLGTCESLPCNWVTQVGQKLDPYIAGDPYYVTLDQAKGLDECKMSCLEESTFICAAVNYRQYDRRCELLEENDQTAVPLIDSNYQYSLRPICAGFWQPWIAADTASILSTGVDRINDTDTEDLRSCMSRCVQHVGDKNCSSIVKSRMSSNKTCELISKRSDYELQSEPSAEWQYFDRPSWYLDNAPGARGVTVKKRSDRGSDYIILNYNPIEADGYLVAWQYYTRSSGVPCPTFAAVWNEVPSNKSQFKLLSETLLYSGSQNAITFHFITGTIIKVKQGYVPSTYVRDSTNCYGNLITYRNLGPYGYIGRMESINGITVGDSLDVDVFQQRGVSLRPFIAEYLVVAESSVHISRVPTFGANIQWDDPIGYLSLERGQQNISGGGFQLTCATNDTFSNDSLVPCFSGVSSNLYPIISRSATLSLPNYTQRYYARIEVVRNFNGNKIVDEKHKDTGPFCARRPMIGNDQVEVHDSGLLRPGEQRSVSLKVSLVDSCIESIIVYDESGQLPNESHTTNVWSFTKQQGASFTIRIIANLIGGYHQDVWIGQYTTKKVPQAPAGVRVIERLSHSARITWDDINNYTDAKIAEYQVDCKVSNNSFNTEADLYSSLPLTFTTHTDDVSDLVADGLLPQVQYQCQVKALLEAGGFGYSSSYISLWTKPQYPMLSIWPMCIETVVYDDNVTITLPNVTVINNFDRRFTSLWLAVKKEGSARKKRSLVTTRKLTIDGISTYIAAKIALGKTSSTFVVGDGEMYGGSLNKELELGDYTIYVGYQAATEEEVTEYYLLNQEPFRVILPGTSIKPKLRPTPGAIIGGIVAGLLAVVVVILLVVIFVQHREKSKHPTGSQMSGHVDISPEGVQNNDEYEEVGEGNLKENPTSAATALISRGSDTLQNTRSRSTVVKAGYVDMGGAAKYEMVDISGQSADQHVYSNLNN